MMSRKGEGEPKQPQTPEALPGEVKFAGKYLTLSTEQRGDALLERVKVRDGISVIEVTSDNKIRLIEEVDIDGNRKLKPVSGYIRPGEASRACAEREFGEERGASAQTWEEFIVSESENPSVRHTQTFFLVRGVTEGQAKPGANEQIFGTVDLTPEEVLKLAFEGKFGSRETAFALVKLALQLLDKK